jgi:hypothetical protein
MISTLLYLTFFKTVRLIQVSLQLVSNFISATDEFLKGESHFTNTDNDWERHSVNSIDQETYALRQSPSSPKACKKRLNKVVPKIPVGEDYFSLSTSHINLIPEIANLSLPSPRALPPAKRSRSNSVDFTHRISSSASSDNCNSYQTPQKNLSYNDLSASRTSPTTVLKPKVELLESFFDLFSCGDLNHVYCCLGQLCDPAINVQFSNFLPPFPCSGISSNFNGLFMFWAIMHVLHPDGSIKTLERRSASTMAPTTPALTPVMAFSSRKTVNDHLTNGGSTTPRGCGSCPMSKVVSPVGSYSSSLKLNPSSSCASHDNSSSVSLGSGLVKIEYIIKFSGTLLSLKSLKETFSELEGLFQTPFVRNYAGFTGGHPFDPNGSNYPAYYPSFDFITSAVIDYLAMQKSNQMMNNTMNNHVQTHRRVRSSSSDMGDDSFQHGCNYIMELSMTYSTTHNKIFDWKMDLLAE